MSKTCYLWDPIEDNIVKDFVDEGTAIADYTTEPNLPGHFLRQRRNSDLRYHHFDAQGSTIAITDHAANVTDTRQYSAYGEMSESTGLAAVELQFLGQLGYRTLDTQERLIVRGDIFSPALARWTTSSPALQQGLTSYLFAPTRTPRRAAIAHPRRAHWCRVELVCTRLGAPGVKHCGIEVTDSAGSDHFHVAAPNAGPPDRCVFTPGRIAPLGQQWLTHYETFSSWTDMTGKLCRCLRASVLIFNTANLPYTAIPVNVYKWNGKSCVSASSCNSNYATRCLMNRCGLRVITSGGWNPWWIDPPGWDHRIHKCSIGKDVRVGICPYTAHLYCSCTKWVIADDFLCGFNPNGSITEQPGPYPRSPYSE